MKLKSYFFRDLVLLFILFSFSSSLMAQNKDKELENSGSNLIDGILNLDKYMKEQAKKAKENGVE